MKSKIAENKFISILETSQQFIHGGPWKIVQA